MKVGNMTELEGVPFPYSVMIMMVVGMEIQRLPINMSLAGHLEELLRANLPEAINPAQKRRMRNWGMIIVG